MNFQRVDHKKLVAWMVSSYESCAYFGLIETIIVWGIWWVLFLCFVGVDFKIKLLTVAEKRIKMTIWDTGSKLNLSILSFYDAIFIEGSLKCLQISEQKLIFLIILYVESITMNW